MQAAGGQVFLAPSQKLGEAPEFIFAAHSQLAANAEKLHLQLTPRSDLPQGASQLKPVRIGIYKSFLGPIDEGWTRFVFDQYGFKYKSIENKEMRAGNLNNSYDVILLPDTPRDGILEGRESRFSAGVEVPPEYTGGIGKDGVHALRDFVDKGGTVITLANASDVLIGEDFGLPVRNALANQGGPGGRADTLTGDFNVPGSLLRVYLDTNHPVAAGMPNEINAFVDSPIAFQTSVPPPDIQRSVISWYPDDAKDILVSGYAHGAERLQRKAAKSPPSSAAPLPSRSSAVRAKSSCSVSAFSIARKWRARSSSSLMPSSGPARKGWMRLHSISCASEFGLRGVQVQPSCGARPRRGEHVKR
jgi:hypothetical protein